MADSTEIHIKNIQAKLQLLLKKYAAAVKENSRLTRENSAFQKNEKLHEEKIEQLISDISEENEDLKIDQDSIEETAKETEKKAVKMMKTYLGEDPDSSEAIEFLAIAEGGEVIHYEVLHAISKNFKGKELSNTINSILKEEQKHLQLCIDLAKESVS